jgi:hypothetical protein
MKSFTTYRIKKKQKINIEISEMKNTDQVGFKKKINPEMVNEMAPLQIAARLFGVIFF